MAFAHNLMRSLGEGREAFVFAGTQTPQLRLGTL